MKKSTEPPLLRSLVIILNLIIYAWVAVILYNTFKTTENPPEGQIERENSEIITIEGKVLRASVPPVYIEPRVMGIHYQLNGDERTWDTQIAYAIMMAESHGNANLINWRDYHRTANCWGSFGLFQIGCLHFGKYGITKDNWDDPEVNIQAAYELWQKEGWWPWSVFKNKRYLKFLN